MPAKERDRVMDAFRSGEARVLITTNVLARGRNLFMESANSAKVLTCCKYLSLSTMICLLFTSQRATLTVRPICIVLVVPLVMETVVLHSIS
jgi:hypothetical protein